MAPGDVSIDEVNQEEAEGRELLPLNNASPTQQLVHFSNCLKLSDIKRRAKQHKVTVNDFILGCISKATCLYSQGSQERITIALAASMHTAEKDLRKFTPSNEVVSVPIILRLKIDLASAIEEASKATVCLRDSDFASFLHTRAIDKLNYEPLDTFNN